MSPKDRETTGSGPESGSKLEPGDQAAPGTPGTGENVCPACRGTGKREAASCPTCGGTGVVIEGISGG